MAELTKYGFERESYSELFENIKDMFRQEFGNGIALDNENVAGQFASLLAKLENDINLKLESIYSSQTLAGSEGIYRDDLLSRNGVFRKGKQAGSGIATIEVDKDMPNNYNLLEANTFKASNGKTYIPENDWLLSTVVQAVEITEGDIDLSSSYTFNITNTIIGGTEVLVFETDETEESKTSMLNALLSSFLSITDQNESLCSFEDGVLRLGFRNGSVVGVAETLEFYSTPSIGKRWCGVPVICTEEGYYPVPAGTLKQIGVEFTGFLSVTNILPFSPGAEVETDASYLSRYFTELEAQAKSSREGIINAVLGVDGVSKVRVYDNPTQYNTTEADAFSFCVVTLGGANSDISQAIYSAKPINTKTSGAVSFTVNTLDGDTEVIRHTNATQVGINVRIVYSTQNRQPLSSVEKQSILSSLETYFSTIDIGETVYNTQLVFNILGSSGSGRITTASVFVKRETENSSLYVQADAVPAYNEVFTFTTGGTEFVQRI